MKIRNRIKYEWWFNPYKTSKLFDKLPPYKGVFRFKYKSDLLKFLNNNFEEALNGTVSLNYESFSSSGTLREYFVWFNDYKSPNTPLKIILKQLDFRGKKYVHKIHGLNKISKKYFSQSNKRMSLMWFIGEYGINNNHAKNLINIFYKSGFKDFIPSEEDQEYIDYYLKDDEEIPWWYWSDRCSFLRMKVILEYFKKENLI